MKKSQVYFTNLRTYNDDSLLMKLERLIRAAGIADIDFQGKYAAIKIHFGELGNLSFLRPNYARVVSDVIRSLGGKPFLTDCNTLYVGKRSNALDHIDTAYLNGFTPYSTGCQILIGDGLRGTDDVRVPVPGGKYVREAKIGRAIMDADIFISLTHFKGHELTGFGGTLKNIGMGCGSNDGKRELHCDGKPYVVKEKCVGCGVCVDSCAQDAPTVADGKAMIDTNACAGCGRCIKACPQGAISSPTEDAGEILNYRIAEYTKAVLHGRPNFHISLVIDVSPCCDCHPSNDMAIVPDVGMFASFDPLALDVACADAVNRQPAIPGSVLSACNHTGQGLQGHDHFGAIAPNTNWKSAITHGKAIGLGSDEYELITVE